MRLGDREITVRHPRLWLGILGALLALFVVYAVWSTWFNQSENPNSHEPMPQSVAPQPLTPSSYEQTRRRFGPWQLVKMQKASKSNLLMFRGNGGVEMSSKAVRATQHWLPASAPEIQSASSNGKKVTFIVYGHPQFVQYRQAFVLESRPDTLYGFVHTSQSDAMLFSIPVATRFPR